MLKDKLLNEINQIPDEQLDELYDLVVKFKIRHKKTMSDQELKNLLLKAPTWDEAEEQNIIELRRKMHTWKPPQYS